MKDKDYTIDVLEGQVKFILDAASLRNSSLITTSYVNTAFPQNIFLTYVRTMDGNALLENLRQAKKAGQPCYLVFREEGVDYKLPILAGRNIKTDEGDIAIIWINYTGELHPIDK